jgi:hypothetical protein
LLLATGEPAPRLVYVHGFIRAGEAQVARQRVDPVS